MREGTPRLGDVAVMALPDGTFGACQVRHVGDDVISIAALDWYGQHPPSLEELEGCPVLVLSHHLFRSANAVVGINRYDPVPPWITWLGSRPLPARLAVPSSSLAGWQWLPIQVLAQRRWDVEVPVEAKRAYRVAKLGDVNVDFGAGPVVLSASTSHLDLADTQGVQLPRIGPIDWSGLNMLPRVTHLRWTGPDRGLTSALARMPIIENLIWEDPPSDVDLSHTRLESASLRGETLRRLYLPASLRSLNIADSDESMTVVAPNNGRWLQLSMETTRPYQPIPVGLSEVRELVLTGGGEISAQHIATLSRLEELSLKWRKPPGLLIDAHQLASLDRLVTVRLTDGYANVANSFPDIPSLTHLSIDGLTQAATSDWRARYGATTVNLVVSGARSESWLAANHSNPFRHWIDLDAAGGAAACKTYAKALRAVDKIASAGPQKLNEIQRILHTMVSELDRIGTKYGIIDQIGTEDASEALYHLAEIAGVERRVADEWFDDWRNF